MVISKVICIPLVTNAFFFLFFFFGGGGGGQDRVAVKRMCREEKDVGLNLAAT